MKPERIIGVIGILGIIIALWLGLIVFEPKSALGSFFGIIGIFMGVFPSVYLWYKGEDK